MYVCMCVCIHHVLIYLSTDGYVGCFLILASINNVNNIVNNAAISLGVHGGNLVSVMFNSCDRMDCSLPGSSVHGDSPGNNTGVGCHFLLQGVFLTQELNPSLLHCRQILY